MKKTMIVAALVAAFAGCTSSTSIKWGGRKAVRLPRKCAKVVDLIGGRTVATDCTAFEDDFATPDTKIYEMVAE